MTARKEFSRLALESQGFTGWMVFDQLAEDLPNVTASGGVYVVSRSAGPAKYLDTNPGGRFKGRDPTVSLDALESNWVDGAEVVYIGKANNLRRRLREFVRFGQGAPIGHWGGRLIWQLEDSGSLVVAWMETPGESPAEVEARLISKFRAAYGRPPFANDPHRLGA